MNTEMMAAVLHGREDLRVEPVAVPAARPGDVLVRVRAALTCGTDVKVFQRGYHARMIVPPALFGHELAGDIVALGEGVRGFKVGQRVVSANSAPCSRNGSPRTLRFKWRTAEWTWHSIASSSAHCSSPIVRLPIRAACRRRRAPDS